MEQSADALPCGFDRAFSGFSQEEFEFGEDLFDRVEVGAVGRPEQQLGALPFHDDDVTGS